MSLLVKDLESMGALPLETWLQDPLGHFRSLDTLPNADDPAIRHALASAQSGPSVLPSSTRSSTYTRGNTSSTSAPNDAQKRKHWEVPGENKGHGKNKKKKVNKK
jgi:hypothetical protein